VAWAARVRLAELIPGGVYEPVQAYLNGVLRGSRQRAGYLPAATLSASVSAVWKPYGNMLASARTFCRVCAS
jgi:hypothetical protein